MMWFFLLLYVAHMDFGVVAKPGDVNRLILRDGKQPCEGHVAIYHDNQWGYVGDEYWTEKTEEVVCRSAHCGTRVGTENGTRVRTENVPRLYERPVWLNELRCVGNEMDLWACPNPGWNISHYHKETVKKIKCPKNISIELDGFKCAGAVQYLTDGIPSGYVCGTNNWGRDEANLVCKSLNCGKVMEIPDWQLMVWKGFEDSMTIHCSDTKELSNLWQCAAQETKSCKKPASVICTGYERLQLRQDTSVSSPDVCSGWLEKEQNGKWMDAKNSTLNPDAWCQQMYCGTRVTVDPSKDGNGIQLNCSDTVKVVLMDNDGKDSSCYGTVHIKVNENSPQPVCVSTWTQQAANVVCKELNCGTAIIKEAQKTRKRGIMEHVKCTGGESSLWHCMAKHGDSLTCKSTAYVVCSASVKVRLVDGPGKCAGRVEIQLEGQWKRVNKEGWNDKSSNTVCRELDCGENRKKSSNPERFARGSADFLDRRVDCKKNVPNISTCILEKKSPSSSSPKQQDPLEITCTEHKVMFLDGNVSCSGKVGIENGSQSYWLSGSNVTWNKQLADAVCHQMHCGSADNFTNTSMKEEVVCLPKPESLFECQNTTQPSDHNSTIATVICSGTIKVNLTKRCWGYVNICMGDRCGGVGEDTWTDTQSLMLCKNLGCGKNMPKAITPLRDNKDQVIFKSVHSTKTTSNLNQCTFVMHQHNETSNTNPAHVVCTGSVKTKFSPSKDKCTGNVEVYYEDSWLPVCKRALTENQYTHHILCRELECGDSNKTVDYIGSKEKTAFVISQIHCPTTGSLAACDFTPQKKPPSCPLGGLQCSEWRKMELRYSDQACSGEVYVHSKDGESAVSMEGWTTSAGDRLCQDLECGSLNSMSGLGARDAFWNASFNCTGVKNPQNIWDCENTTSLSHKRQLFIQCQGVPKVALSQPCGGELTIDKMKVCNTHWKMKYSDMVCHELNCSNAIVSHSFEKHPDKEYFHVTCEEYHHKLGQCKRLKAKCDGGLVSVYCVDNVKFQWKTKPEETCGGEIEVNYRNKWEGVSLLKSTPKVKNMLCEELGCDAPNGSIKTTTQTKPVNMETSLNCNDNHNDIKYCVETQQKTQEASTFIYCKGYKGKIKPIDPPQPSKWPIILGVGFLLFLVVLLAVLIPICIAKRANNTRRILSKMLPRKEVEFESGDYEDVTSKANEMEDFSGATFRSRSEAAVISERDPGSASSYDDIDEPVEMWPLTALPAPAAGASGDKHSHDGVSYEVEDPQENYDDIEALPVMTQTAAQVHHSPHTSPLSLTLAPVELVEGDDDYLVPGQNG